jgi:hypothetical protein
MGFSAYGVILPDRGYGADRPVGIHAEREMQMDYLEFLLALQDTRIAMPRLLSSMNIPDENKVKWRDCFSAQYHAVEGDYIRGDSILSGGELVLQGSETFAASIVPRSTILLPEVINADTLEGTLFRLLDKDSRTGILSRLTPEKNREYALGMLKTLDIF